MAEVMLVSEPDQELEFPMFVSARFEEDDEWGSGDSEKWDTEEDEDDDWDDEEEDDDWDDEEDDDDDLDEDEWEEEEEADEEF